MVIITELAAETKAAETKAKTKNHHYILPIKRAA
jgi:hypothetical protein